MNVIHFREVAGPWQNEPDEYHWQFRGLKCSIIRCRETGCWAGFVLVDPPIYIDTKKLIVHGGITFEQIRWNIFTSYWIGFDCAHWGDFCPQVAAILAENSNRAFANSYSALANRFYRDMPFVIEQTEKLAQQVKSCYK